MKNVFSFAFCIAMVFSSCDFILTDESISGNGNVIEREREVSGFRGLKVTNGIDVFFTQGETEELLLIADENLHEHIKTEVRDGILRIGSDVNLRRPKELKIMLKVIELDKISISSAGDVRSENQLITENLDIVLSSAGNLKLNVSANTIDCNISSSGDVTLWGSADILIADLSSAGDLHAFDLIARSVKVDVSSAGDAEVHATGEIEMNASSAGDVRYKGIARVIKSNTSSAGSIKKVD
jgi:hypothetical protein